jgi:hypothetical protein
LLDLDWREERFPGNIEISYFLGTLGSAQRSASSISNTASGSGLLAIGFFGNGFQRIAGGQSSYQNQVATASSANINITNIAENENTEDIVGNVLDPATVWTTTLEAGGSNYVEVDPTETYIYYTSGGWYYPVGGQNIYRLTIADGTITTFATVPAGPGPNPGLKGLFPLPDGSVLVCNGGEVVRVDSGGSVTQTYTPAETDLAQSLADIEPTSDGEAFWVWDEANASFWKFNLSTGAQILHFRAYLGSGSSTSIVVYRKDTDGQVELPPSVNVEVAAPGSLALGTGQTSIEVCFIFVDM